MGREGECNDIDAIPPPQYVWKDRKAIVSTGNDRSFDRIFCNLFTWMRSFPGVQQIKSTSYFNGCIRNCSTSLFFIFSLFF